MIKRMNWGVLFLLSILMFGCYPKGAETLNDTNLILTNYDDNFDFTSDKTYYLSPEVVYIDTTDTPNSTVNQTILSEVRSQFAAIGWTELDTITDPSDVNLVVLTSILSTSITSISYYPGYGGWYGGWWGGWGYPCCGYYYPVSYTYNVGTIFIDGFDGQTIEVGGDDLPPIVWSAAMNGVLGSQLSTASQTRIRSVIDQAFLQSPYLK
jgi:hypothetical protein